MDKDLTISMRALMEASGISKEVIHGWLWHQRNDMPIAPMHMSTTHLFYTLRMIWNHSMPDDAKIEPYQRYRFGPKYTPEYMGQAIIAIGVELATRDDLPIKETNQLRRMMNYFRLRRIRFNDKGKLERWDI